MTKELQTTLIGAAAGAIAGLIVNVFFNRWKIWKLHHHLRLEPQRRIGTRGTVRIHNAYIYPLNSVYAYISVEYDLSDVIDPPDPFQAYITKSHLCKLYEDRLCWSTTMPTPNPPQVDIYPGERQALDVININNNDDWIEIPSERGWATSQDVRVVVDLKQTGKNDEIKKS